MLSLFLESHGKHKFPEEDDKADSGIPKMGTCSGGRQIPFNMGTKTADGMKIDLNDIKNAQFGSCGGGIPADAFETDKKKKKKKSTKKKSEPKKVDENVKTANEGEKNEEKIAEEKPLKESQEVKAQAPVVTESDKNTKNNVENKESQPNQEEAKDKKDEL